MKVSSYTADEAGSVKSLIDDLRVSADADGVSVSIAEIGDVYDSKGDAVDGYHFDIRLMVDAVDPEEHQKLHDALSALRPFLVERDQPINVFV
jgi:hypothetical protein